MLNDIKINGDKSELLVFNHKETMQQAKVIIGRNQSVVVNTLPNVPVRFLGIWITRKKSRKHTVNMCYKYIKDTANQLERKNITMAHALYIFNIVVIPRVLYLMQITEFSDSDA